MPPRTPRSSTQIDAGSEYLGQEQQGAIGEIRTTAGVDVVDKPLPKGALELEAFMNEPVTILVNPATDPDEPRLVQVGVNGVNQFLPRGEQITVKRKYVEVLARAKRTNFSQTLDERLGEGMNHLKAMHLLRFPFSVIEDRNPNGGPWLRGVLAEAR